MWTVCGCKMSLLVQRNLHLLHRHYYSSVSYSKLKWNKHFSYLKIYKLANGNCCVPNNYLTPSGFNLGNWVRALRNGKVAHTPERQRKLSSIDFEWDPRDESWNHHMKLLENYRNQYGDCLVPNAYDTPTNENLGWWAQCIRHGNIYLPRCRIIQLEQLGFIWNVWYIEAKVWERFITQLQNYMKTHGDCHVPYDYNTPNGMKLGWWVDWIRKGVTPERRSQVNALSFVFRCKDLEIFWEYRDYVEALVYAYKVDHCDGTPKGHCEDPSWQQINDWVIDVLQGTLTMPSERRHQLEALEFQWQNYENMVINGADENDRSLDSN